MSVQISSVDHNKVSIVIEKGNIHTLLSYLAHAKFSDEIKVYVLLSPLINELFRSILEFSDKTYLIETGSAVWKRQIPEEEITNPLSFASQVFDILVREYGSDQARELLPEALYPNQLVSS